MLLYPSEEEKTWTIYNATESKYLNLKLSLSYKKSFCGSSQGCLVSVNDNYTVSIHKPSYTAQGSESSTEAATKIDLPWNPEDVEFYNQQQGNHGCDHHVIRTLISTDPFLDPDNCVVMVIYGDLSEIAFFRYTKDTAWNATANGNYVDMVYYKNQFYAVTYHGKLVSFDVTNPSTAVKCIAPKFLPYTPAVKRYIVESREKLLQVVRYFEYSDEDRWTVNFRVFRMDFDRGRWEEIKTLGGASLFLGDNSSVSVMASDFPACQPNCIYFTQDEDGVRVDQYSDLGIYDMESESFKFHFGIDETTFSRALKRRPIWILFP